MEGDLDFTRHIFECPKCRKSFSPIDDELGLQPHERLSRSVQEKIAWYAKMASFQDASETMNHCHGLQVSSSEVARIVHCDGRAVFEKQLEKDDRWREPVDGKNPVYPPEIQTKNLVLELDGTIVLTRSGEEHKTVWCGRGFDLSARTDNGSDRPTIIDSRYCASAGSLEDFEDRFLALANRMGARGADRIIVVADGAEPLWNLVKRRVPNAVQIQDFWHVSEHLFDVAKSIFDEDPKEAKEKGKEWKDMLYNGKIDEIIGVLREQHKHRRGKKRDLLESEIKYLEKGRDRMDYARFRENGWPMGSGAIEGTCKHLVKQRFNITGARWKRDEIDDLLALRVAHKNLEWEQYWGIKAA